MNPLILAMEFVPVLGAIGVIVLAQTQVRERSEKAALMMSIGAGLEIALAAGRSFTDREILFMLAGAVHTASVALVAYGLITLADELNPKFPSPLPAILDVKSTANAVPRIMLGVFAGLWIFSSGIARAQPQFAIIALAAIAFVLWGSLWIERQGPLAKFVLERRPDLVVWSYVHQLRVINRQTGSTSTHWSAQVGLSTGALVPIGATSEGHAQQMVAAVAQRCPGIALGFSHEIQARFKSNPQSLRAAGAPMPTFGAISR